MKGRWRTFLIAAFVAVACVFSAPLMAGDEDLSYWDRFRMLFIDWDDDSNVGTARTEVTGVRGLDIEEKLGDEGYDWSAVKYMEDYQVSIEEEMAFLKAGGLGPYQGQGAGHEGR